MSSYQKECPDCNKMVHYGDESYGGDEGKIYAFHKAHFCEPDWKGKFEKLQEENRQLKEYIKDCYIQEYAGARYSCKHCTRLEDQGHYSHCPIVRFGLDKEQSND